MRPDAHVLRRRFFLAIRRLAAILWIAALAGPCAGVLHAAEWLVVPAASPPGADDDALHVLLASWKDQIKPRMEKVLQAAQKALSSHHRRLLSQADMIERFCTEAYHLTR